MKTVSVKAKISSKLVQADGQVSLSIMANYTDDEGNRVNEEWAKYTPVFHTSMTVKDEDVMAAFNQGDAVTILIQKED